MVISFIVILFILLLILIFYGRITLGFTFIMDNLVCSSFITIYYSKNKPLKKIMLYPAQKKNKKNKAEKVKRKRDINQIKKSIYAIIKLFKNSLIVREFKIYVKEGTGDACYTALLYGLLWNMEALITKEIIEKYNVKSKKIKIEADFKEKIWKLNLHCIFSLKIVNIIFMCKEIIIYYLKNKKGGVDDVRSSDRRSNDYSHAEY